MVLNRRTKFEQRFEQFIGNLLRVGVIFATVLVLTGGILYLIHHRTEVPDYQFFRGEPAEFRTPSGVKTSILSGLSMFEPRDYSTRTTATDCYSSYESGFFFVSLCATKRLYLYHCDSNCTGWADLQSHGINGFYCIINTLPFPQIYASGGDTDADKNCLR